MTAEILNLFGTKTKKRRQKPKEKTDRWEDAIFDVLERCMDTGEVDAKLMNKLFRDVRDGSFSDLDILAMYLYRKKVKG